MTALARTTPPQSRQGPVLPAPTALPDEDLASCLMRFRLRAGYSQNGLAKRVGINASYINRLESGERGRPTESVVLALARGLGLMPADTDTLLLAAGYAPTWLQYLGDTDSTIRAVAEFLTNDALDDATVADFRAG